MVGNPQGNMHDVKVGPTEVVKRFITGESIGYGQFYPDKRPLYEIHTNLSILIY